MEGCPKPSIAILEPNIHYLDALGQQKRWGEAGASAPKRCRDPQCQAAVGRGPACCPGSGGKAFHMGFRGSSKVLRRSASLCGGSQQAFQQPVSLLGALLGPAQACRGLQGLKRPTAGLPRACQPQGPFQGPARGLQGLPGLSKPQGF